MQSKLPRGATAVVALLVAVALAGCGGRASPLRSGAAADREWVSNTSGVIDQLRGDVAAVAPSGASLGSAARALRDDSDLYALLVAYTDFGGCAQMVGSAGSPPPRYSRVASALTRACRGFEQAAALFTQANTRNDPRALLAASRRVKVAARLLYRAELSFAAAQTSGGQ